MGENFWELNGPFVLTSFLDYGREKGPAVDFVRWNKLGFEVNPLEEVDGAIEVPRTCGVHD